MKSNHIVLAPSSIVRVLGVVALLLILASAVTQFVSYVTGRDGIYGLVPLFNLDAEQNIPSFFSTFLLLFADLLLWIIAILKKNHKAAHVSEWIVLSVGFFIMAVDESASIHELLDRPLHMVLGEGIHNMAYSPGSFSVSRLYAFSDCSS